MNQERFIQTGVVNNFNSLLIGRSAISLLAAVSLLASPSIAQAQAESISATVNGQLVYFADVQPKMVGKGVYVPLRGVFDAMECKVSWNESTKMVSASKDGITVDLVLGSLTASVNGQMKKLNQPSMMEKGRVLVPIRFFAESLGAKVDWVAGSRTVMIQTGTMSSAFSDYRIAEGSVLTFTINDRLSSGEHQENDTFTATVKPSSSRRESGLPVGAVLHGHLGYVRAKTDLEPGVLTLLFDKIKLSQESNPVDIQCWLIGLDTKSVEQKGEVLKAVALTNNPNLKYVGYQSEDGVVMSFIEATTRLSLGSNSGSSATQVQPSQVVRNAPYEVILQPGTTIGARLTQAFTYSFNKTN